MKKIPITIITGFLGSGKTTLLHHLLKYPGQRKIAVIMNEFGEVGVDGELLKSSDCGCDEDGLIELNNGCLCCTVQEEFLPTLQQMLERKDNIDHIVIETSGLALPKPLLRAINWPDLKPHFTIDAVITVVDAVGQATGEICDRAKVQQQREADDSLDHETPIEELFEDQLNAADLVVMSKKDLVEEGTYQVIYDIITSKLRNDSVKIIPSIKGQVDADLLLGLEIAAEDDLDTRYSHHEAAHESGAHHHHHDEGFQSISLEVDLPHTPGQLVQALDQLVQELEIYRVKGFIHIPGKPMRMVIQGVGDRFDKYFDRQWKEGEKRTTQLVVIGNNIEDKDIVSRIRQKLESKLAV
ncbi:MAG: cobalamin biosynthesis protein CobW [Cytophagales bacterium]|nr:cobalamin biosynthesis protein CobW [Cytophagales bacterium]